MNKYIKIIFALFIASQLVSCDLDRYPRNAILFEDSFQTMPDVRAWNNGIFTAFRGRHNGAFTLLQDVQTDKLNATVGFGNRMGMPHNWVPFNAGDATLRSVWNAYYSGIANANHIINSMPEFIEDGRYVVFIDGRTVNETATNANRTELDRILGNAHFVRAFYYHQLALRWSNPAVPASLSVPIVREFNPDYRPARATVAQVHQFILEDIAVAREKLAGVANMPRNPRFGTDVVDALEARVRFFMQDWVAAYEIADGLIASGLYPLETTPAGMQNLWWNDTSNEVIMQPHIAFPTEMPGNSNNIYITRNPNTGRNNPDFLPAQWIIDLFAANDRRRAVYFCTGVAPSFHAGRSVELGGTIFPPGTITLVGKFPGRPGITNSQWGGSGNERFESGALVSNVHAPKPFRIAEMHLIAAESAFMAGEQGLALTALNRLRVARGIGALIGISGDALLQEIKNERTRELAFEGFRLWDLRRWGLPMERRTPQAALGFPNFLMQGANFTELHIPAGHDRFVWGIPSSDVMLNPNLVQNPGW